MCPPSYDQNDEQPTPLNSDSNSEPETPEEMKAQETREDEQSLADRLAALQHPDYPHNLDPEYQEKTESIDPYAATADNDPVYKTELENALANQRESRICRGVPSASDVRQSPNLPGPARDVTGSHYHTHSLSLSSTEGITLEDVQEAMLYMGIHNPKPEIPLHLTVTGHEIVAIARMFRSLRELPR